MWRVKEIIIKKSCSGEENVLLFCLLPHESFKRVKKLASLLNLTFAIDACVLQQANAN